MSTNFNTTENHQHTGADAPRLNPKHFLGFPVVESDALDFDTLQGTILIRKTSLNAYYLAVFTDGVWRETQLTSIAS